jgi:DNA-binding IclR family transcriptional regulator
VETFDAEMLDVYAQACGWVLARAHAKASEISATISGYLGSSNDAFDTAMGKFALAYADQTERDHAALEAAARKGKIAVSREAQA